ncbi:Rossmann-like and DUF2520 domain-containing protein [Rhodoferax sp.]|uniref:Rossmann-like and DUF2520 domain-containing protein n=1 Tax=Rhodoferax sp. TaxID=50421 RepID=UPI001EC10EB5|nr:Rossmann-like and DUF2520 domain-containing protein [Rhodoferax sp.]MBT9508217.1 DUF2520 domain-containing protein [Rhodoferax sp.]
MKSLNIIGGGRVGRTLGRLWHDRGAYLIQDVLTNSAASASEAIAFIGAGHVAGALQTLRAADVWMLAVPDRQIAAVASGLAQTASANRPSIAFHCSGALASTELQPLRDLGWHVASAHCLLSFASPQAALQQFPGTPCALEGDAAVLAELEPSFQAIGARCFAILAEHKLLYHAGAVFATNFLPVLQSLANRLWQDSGVPPELALQLNKSLLQNAVDNILALGPAGALTGPAARGDKALVARQGQAVAQWNMAAGQAYAALSQLAAEMGTIPLPPSPAPDM